MQKIKVISLNANGIRAAKKKGLIEWIVSQAPDYICIQETRAQKKDLDLSFFSIALNNSCLKGTYNFSMKPGYSGVAIFSQKQPTKIIAGINVPEFDAEGRVLRMDFDNLYDSSPSFSLVSIYFPSGSASEKRQESKFRFLAEIKKKLWEWDKEQNLTGRQFLICGDWNIAHEEIDLKNWKQNKKNSGFLPEEREWLTDVFDKGWRDIFDTSAQMMLLIPGGVRGAGLVKTMLDGELITRLLQQTLPIDVGKFGLKKNQSFQTMLHLLLSMTYSFFIQWSHLR